ncbi:MAG TPA: FtsX-like permease family protein [Baekduia sp.]|uniref:ABC transporter permease n=1 Tax=Baekduia sp. TaxID=2600305 RepID=UPI002D769421|nr:FtsX-like permease family protein [Baekduia sp.]HET6508584.1 FtsX-like permease family protein [Baekduia sp.]
MRKIALRGLFARKLRLALTALAVALGVTLIAGTYIFTDTITKSFDNIFVQSNKGTDVALSPNNDLAGDEDPPPIPGSVLTRVEKVDGVAQAEGSVFSQGGSFRKGDGSKLKGQGFNAIAGAHDVQRFEAFVAKDGHLPRTADEVAIPKATADNNHLKVGDKLEIQDAAPKKTYTISGIGTIAGVDSFGGGVIAVLTLPEAQRMTGHEDSYDEIEVAAKPGVTPEELKARLAKVVPQNVQVRTGTEQAAKQTKDIKTGFLDFLRTALLAFAGISLFVGAFLIFNTFSITVAQRTREFALLRVLGAKRRQVMRSVLAEGLILGVFGSAVGLVLGIGVAAGLKALFKAVGADLPSTATVIETRTIVVSLLVGTIATLVSTLAPAIRATRVPPLAALREGLDSGRKRSRWSTPLSAVLTVAGLGFMVLGLFGGGKASTALSLMGLGAAMTFLGVAFLSPRLVGPIAGFVGTPFERFRGITGRIARENTVRFPGRTAVTAGALMVGVALVTFASIFAAGAKSTIRDAVTSGSRAQAIVESTNFGSFSPQATAAVAKVPGVKVVGALRNGVARVDGAKKGVTGVDPTLPDLYHADWKQGNDNVIRHLGPRDIVVSKSYAEDNDVKVGQTLTLETSKVKALPLKVTGIIDDKGGLYSALTVSKDTMAQQFGVSKDSFVLVGYNGSRPASAVKADIDRLLNNQFPEAEAKTNAEFISQQEGQVNQLLTLIYALLAMAIIVSLFGIVNTLVLSISERVRELGLLRAIGMSRRQVRRVIRYEAIITAQIGAVIGMVLGIVLSVLVTRAIDGFKLSIPIPTLVLLLILSAFAGVLAAILPARRASRLDVLESLAYE